MKLSKTQIAIVKSPIGPPMQVLASAGSGKTRVLTERIRYILESTKKDGVIALTFTNKAAEEMLVRLDDVKEIGERCWISTIHSVAQRILEQYGHTIGLPSELHIYEREQDLKQIFLQSLRDAGTDLDVFFGADDGEESKRRNQVISRYMEQIAFVKRNLLTEDEISEKYEADESFGNIFQSYQSTLLAGGGVDFDDILVYAHRILLEQPWCAKVYRAKYKHICVDEAQDLNRAQYEFVKVLCGESIKSLMLVGDPNQMIYGFNGSSHDYLCKYFVSDFSPTKFSLKENYRSSKAVVRIANKLRPGSQVESEFALDGLSEINGDLENETQEAEWVCNKISELLELRTHEEIEGEISLAKMVVIARNKFVFQTLESILKANKILYSLKKSERMVEPASVLGKVIDLAIRVRLNTKDWVDGKKLCAALKIKAPANWGSESLFKDLAKAARSSKVHYASLQANALEAISRLQLDSPNIPNLCSVFEKAIKELSKASGEDGEIERSLQELQDFRDCWTIFKKKGLGESLSAFRNAMALGQLAEEYNPNGLTLSTVHTMKGLEKDIVFVVGMCEGVFPDYRAKSKSEIEEERNSAFVAVTRSRRWLYLTYPRARMMPWGDIKFQAQSRFIREMET